MKLETACAVLCLGTTIRTAQSFSSSTVFHSRCRNDRSERWHTPTVQLQEAKILDKDNREPFNRMDSNNDPDNVCWNERQGRRDAWNKLMKWSVSTCLAAAFSMTVDYGNSNNEAVAYEQNYPQELDMGDSTTTAVDSTLSQSLQSPQKRRRTERTGLDRNKNSISWNPLEFRNVQDVATSAVWGGALWLLSGSRSNPLATPLANLIYDDRKESWLKDRNEGLFAPLPIPFLLALGVVFFFLGVVVDRSMLLVLLDGDDNISLQLAGVSLIAGAAIELGRISTGEKKQTRQDSDRDTRLAMEFMEFAERRLLPGGNCHRSDVVRAFRRYYAKYRVADNPEYPLSDVEIERLLREWTRSGSITTTTTDNNNIEMSSAGFYKGVQINEDADVFVKR